MVEPLGFCAARPHFGGGIHVRASCWNAPERYAIGFQERAELCCEVRFSGAPVDDVPIERLLNREWLIILFNLGHWYSPRVVFEVLVKGSAMPSRSFGKSTFAVGLLFLFGIATVLSTADRPQWGERYSRNKDADILWLLDLRSAAGVRPHDSCHCSILLDGSYLYLNTNNGLNSKHSGVEKPEAPSLVVVDKVTGRLVAQDDEGIGPRIFHSTWSSPALGTVAGRRLIFFCGGDGVCYAFEALKPGEISSPQSRKAGSSTRDEKGGATQQRAKLRCVWRFDCDPKAPKENVHRYIGNRRESPSNIMSMPVFYHGRVYVTVGGDIWWGKNQAQLLCIDAAGSGDITEGGRLWSYSLDRHCCSTPSIHEGLAYVADCGGKVHCVDAETGRPYWVHDAQGEIWASTLVADGKIHVGMRKGDFWVLAAGKHKRVLGRIRLEDPIVGSVAAANGTLYVATMTRLYAVQEKADKKESP